MFIIAGLIPQVYLSTRRGSWVTNRVHDAGVPSDMNLIRRANVKLLDYLPDWMFNSMAEKQVSLSHFVIAVLCILALT